MDGAINAKRITLVPATPQQLRAKWESPDGTFPPTTSPAWIERVRSATAPDPWVLGSARVLHKCGFTRVADVVDPEDGQLWRFEKARRR